MTLKEKIQRMRMDARRLERKPPQGTDYTCNMVHDSLREAYEHLFEFDDRPLDEFDNPNPDEPSYNESELWNMPEREKRDVRVLMLCLAAAVAETGDLKCPTG